ncbi:unnamed protein product, partial [Linum tenue]
PTKRGCILVNLSRLLTTKLCLIFHPIHETQNKTKKKSIHPSIHPVRCAGLGPTPSTYLGPSCSSASINSTTTSNSNEVDALRSEVIELRNELAKAKSEVVELRSGMDQLQMEVDTLKTLSLQHIRREKGSMEGSIRAPSSSSQSATRG